MAKSSLFQRGVTMTGELRGYGKPAKLCAVGDLLDGYDPNDELAFVQSWDFGTFRRYTTDGGATPDTIEIRLAQAEHDARIAEALKAFLDRKPSPKLVGVMGGHDLSRRTAAYKAVARLGRHLTRRGYLLVTGGDLAPFIVRNASTAHSSTSLRP
jgi:hypothetical protein